MAYRDLRDFIAQLEALGELRRVSAEVSPRLEMTALCDRVLRAGGPALFFEKPSGHTLPVLGNLFGNTRRIALALGANAEADPLLELRRIGELLAALKEPEVVKRLADSGEQPSPSTPEELATELRGDIEKYTKLVKSSGLKLQ